MPNYITNSNLILLTQKLQEEVEGLNRNIPVFPEILKRAHHRKCRNKDRQKKKK